VGNRRLKVGIVGCGTISDRHYRNYKQVPDVDIVAICDRDEAYLKYRQSTWGIPEAYVSYDDMYAKSGVEAVSIALPVDQHMPATLAALRAGRHVLVEKPMAQSAAEAQEMATAAKASGCLLTIGQNQRFDPDVVYLKRCVEAGWFGQVYAVRTLWRRPMGVAKLPVVQRATGPYDRNWANEEEHGGGAARDLGAHVIDLAMYILGFPAMDFVTGGAYAIFGADKFPVEWMEDGKHHYTADDHCLGFVRFKNGAVMQAEASRAQYVRDEVIITEIFGSKGGALRNKGFPLQMYQSVVGLQSTIEPRLPDPTSFPEKDFVECILTGRGPVVTPEQGIQVMRILDGIHQMTTIKG
jgi:predicted dehydrogenase